MIIENADIEGLRSIAEELGVSAVEQKTKHEGTVKMLMRPVVGSNHYRALTVTGRAKPSLCLHGLYAFMSRIFARYPDAILETWVNTWDYTLFQSGAKAWTLNQLRDREKYDACDCTPEMIESAMLTPDELREPALV